MSLVKIIMTPLKKVSQNKLVDLAEDYCCQLSKNGQIIGYEHFYAWIKGVLTYYVEAAMPDALEAQHHSEWAQKALAKLEKAMGCPIAWEAIEDQRPQRHPTLETASFLYLFPSYNQCEPPIHRGDNGKPVPLYMLPIDQFDRQDIDSWNEMSNHFFAIWLNSGPLEIPAYRQISDPRTEHCRYGRKLCQRVEKATGIPTFLYLDRYYGRSEGEEKRRCPFCGEEWHTGVTKTKKSQFWRFDFKCEPCRVVSHLATSVEENEKHAEIGEYRPMTRKKRA